MKRLFSLCLVGSWVLAGCGGAKAGLSRLTDDQGGAIPGLGQKRVGLVAVADDVGRVFAIGGDEASEHPTMEILDPATAQWRPLAAPPVKRFYAGGVYLNGKIYVIGGEDDAPNSDRYATSTLVYDVAANTWTTSGALQLPRSGVAAAAAGGRIFTVGGTGVVFSSPAPAHIPSGDPNFIDAFGVRVSEAYDVATGTSRLIPPVPHRRTHAALAAGADGKVYAFGGWFEGDFYGYPDFSLSVGVTYINAMVEAYDPAGNSWQSVTRMPTPRSDLAAVRGADGRIYTFGGKAEDGAASTAVEAFDPATGRWDVKAPMPTARSGLAAAAGRDGRIYVVGGNSNQFGASAIVEIYDPAANAWTTSHTPAAGDGLTFDGVERLFNAADAVVPAHNDMVAWRAGRCFDYDQKTKALGGLLVGYQVGDSLKVTALETQSLDPDWFDALTADKRTQILAAVDGQNQNLQVARVVDGRYLGSLYSYVNDAGAQRTFEYQVKKTQDWYLTRVVTVTAWGSLPAGATKAVCFHHTETTR